jgi:hypothetical protein
MSFWPGRRRGDVLSEEIGDVVFPVVLLGQSAAPWSGLAGLQV